MSRLVSVLAIGLLSSFIVFSVLAPALGRGRPPNPAMAGFTEGCEGIPQPCWYGIVPGVTTVSEVSKRLENVIYEIVTGSSNQSLDYRSHEAPHCIEIYYDRAAIVNSIALSCTDIRVGDMNVLLGEPDFRVWDSEQDSEWIYGRDFIHLFQGWSQSPFESVQYMRLVLKANANHDPNAIMPWQGFLPRRKYCQLEPTYTGCLS